MSKNKEKVKQAKQKINKRESASYGSNFPSYINPKWRSPIF